MRNHYPLQAFQAFLAASRIQSKKTSIRSPWQNPYAERVIGTLRLELLNHIIPFNEKHLHCLLKEYIDDYYNPHRTHQGISCKTPIPSPKYIPTKSANTKLKNLFLIGFIIIMLKLLNLIIYCMKTFSSEVYLCLKNQSWLLDHSR